MNTPNEQGNPASNSSTVFSVAEFYRDAAESRDSSKTVLLKLSHFDLATIHEWAEAFMHMHEIAEIPNEEGDLHYVINLALDMLKQELESV